MAEKKLKACPDPECKGESPEDTDDCIKCGLSFEAFNSLDRILTIREKRNAAEIGKGKPAKPSILDAFKKVKK